MKKIFFTLLILLSGLFVNNANAQSCIANAQKTYRLPKLDEHSIILDSAGKKLDYTVWNSLVSTGWFGVKVVMMPNGKGVLKLVRSTQQERAVKLAQMPKPADSPYFVNGEAPKQNIKEKDFNGIVWDTKRLKGKIIVLSFWYVNNVNCRMQLPDLNNLAATYKFDSDVVFLSIAMDDKNTVQDFLKIQPFNYTHLEKGKNISEKMGVITHPTDVVIDKEGKVQYHTTGYSAANSYWIAKTIEQIKAPKVEEVLASN
jgi:peroxiredoxin